MWVCENIHGEPHTSTFGLKEHLIIDSNQSNLTVVGWLNQSATTHSRPLGFLLVAVLFTSVFADCSIQAQSLRCGRCPGCRPPSPWVKCGNAAVPPSQKILTVIGSLFSRSPVLFAELLPPAGPLLHASTSFFCSGTRPLPENTVTCSPQCAVSHINIYKHEYTCSDQSPHKH